MKPIKPESKSTPLYPEPVTKSATPYRSVGILESVSPVSTKFVNDSAIKPSTKGNGMGMIEQASHDEEEKIIEAKAVSVADIIEQKVGEVKMNKEELKAYHSEKGGVVLEEAEFSRYKFYLELLAAEQMFDATFPAIAHTTEEFAEIYKERELLAKELEAFRKAHPNSVANELSDPEVGEFVEFLHTSYEVNAEESIHALTHSV